MLLRDKTPPIKSFRLKCVSSYCDHVTVNTWVKAAIQRKVEHLSLSLRYNINLPSSILTCKTLVVLKLTSLSVNATSSADFPSLKTLHLTRVHFLESGHLLEILSKCPVLEVLLIKSVKVTSFYSGVHLKTLPRLVKADISNSPIYIPWTGFYNAEFIRTKVGYSNAIYDEIPTFINLTYMELTFMLCYWDCLMKLLPFCPKLQVLVIDKMDPFIKQSKGKTKIGSIHNMFLNVFYHN